MRTCRRSKRDTCSLRKDYNMKNRISNLISTCFLTALILCIISCEQSTDCCTNIDTNVSILYKNQLGENLINSNSDFEASKIKVYYKDGNEFEYVFNGSLDSPNMHRIVEDPNGDLILTIYPSNYYEGINSTTLIELNQNVVDTLVCEFELSGISEICKRAWLNGVEMVDRFLEVEMVQ